MKNLSNFIYLIFVTSLIACSSSPDKKTELEKLRQDQTKIEEQISTLEKEIALTDTSKSITKKIEVVVEPLVGKTFKSYIDIQGKVDAEESIYLSSQIPGTVSKINVKVGDMVAKETILAETNTRLIDQQIGDLETNLELASQYYNKQKNLWEQKIGTEMQYLQSKTNKESLEKKLATMQEQIRMSKIVTPIDGTVDDINIKIGQIIAPGMPAISVVNLRKLKTKADVAEAYAGRIKRGDQVMMYFPDINDSIKAVVNYAARNINPLSRTFNVEVILPQNNKFQPNMVVKLQINDYTSAKSKLVVPVKYIQKDNDLKFVFIAQKNKVVKKLVTIGREYKGLTEIETGVSEGDLLIINGYDLINEGDIINY